MLKTAEVPKIEYPDSDGKPMAETDDHRIQMTDALIHPLKEYFRDRPDVYVSGNMFLYYVEGEPTAVVAPDVFVVFGVANKRRRIYKLWQEGQVPAVVFELTSRSTRHEDAGDKRFIYEDLGVREYFIFDPLREYLRPPLQGYRLEGGFYTPLLPDELDTSEWELFSEELGLTLQTYGRDLRLYDEARDQYLYTPAEEAEARRTAEAHMLAETQARYEAEARAEAEAAARRAAEAEIARLRALLDQQERP
jgi:Uma2 family endonuclease